jgi:RNA polymerase sigma factor (sigma-70 family)
VGDRVSAALARRSDAELLALTAVEPDAFAAFYLRHHDAIVTFLRRQSGDDEVARDLSSEVFAIAFDAAGRYEPERGEARAWLFGIAKITLLARDRRRAVEHRVRRRLRVSAPVGHAESVHDEVAGRLDALPAELAGGLAELSQIEREAVIARVLGGREYAELARDANTSEAAVRQRVSRGLAKLSKLV